MYALSDRFPAWFSRTSSIRRPLTRLLRLHWRLQRATPASVVVVVRSKDGQVLLLSEESGALQLPRKQLDGWVTIPDQVQDWLRELLAQSVPISLVSVEGACGDVTFVYGAIIDTPQAVVSQAAARWLAPDVAAASLAPDEARLLVLCMGETG